MSKFELILQDIKRRYGNFTQFEDCSDLNIECWLICHYDLDENESVIMAQIIKEHI